MCLILLNTIFFIFFYFDAPSFDFTNVATISSFSYIDCVKLNSIVFKIKVWLKIKLLEYFVSGKYYLLKIFKRFVQK